jgi:hypothetical protein
VSAPYQFSITKTRMLQLGVCLGVIQVLLYTSGVATGLLIGPKAAAMSDSMRARAANPSIQQAEKPPIAKLTAAETPKPGVNGDSAEPKAIGNIAVTQPAPSASPEMASTQSSFSQPATPPSAASQPAVPTTGSMPGVAVQVASFHTRSNAVRLADILKQQGYGPVRIGESSSDGAEIWHFVQLGPYKEWDEASRIVAELDRSYEVHAYVRPIRSALN